jgi:hypothetical protein
MPPARLHLMLSIFRLEHLFEDRFEVEAGKASGKGITDVLERRSDDLHLV